MGYDHWMERQAIKRLWLTTVTQRLIMEDGELKDEQYDVRYGSIIQQVSDELIRDPQSQFSRLFPRWIVLQRNPEKATQYMVRDGWFQLPVIVLWRISRAGHCLWKGFYYAARVMSGKLI